MGDCERHGGPFISLKQTRVECHSDLFVFEGAVFLKQVSASGSALLSVLKSWDSQGRLECGGRLGFSRPVYAVQARGEWSGVKGRV